MFYDLQDISIPFAEYQLSEEEKMDFMQRAQKLVNEYYHVSLAFMEFMHKNPYSFYIMSKNTNECILIYLGECNIIPLLIYLTPNKDWVEDNVLAFLLSQAKRRPKLLHFHRHIYEDEITYVMVRIRVYLHEYDMLPRDRDSEEYESAYIDAMQVLLMMLYDIDYKEIRKRNPKIDTELEELFSIQYADPESYLERKFKKQFYIDGYSRFL